VVIAFVDDHRDRFGVAPICRVLTEHGVPIASNSYYAHKVRARSPRSLRDERVLAEIERVHADPQAGRGLYGVRKMHAALARQGGVDEQPVSRRLVERLMRSAGIQGARRGRRFVTTRADKAAVRPPDLVKRQFSAAAPNRLWVVDFTYVPTWSGMAFTAFVSDVFSRRIVGWRTASSMPTALPLDALEMAIWTRHRAGRTDKHGRLPGLIQHSDAGSQYTAIRYAERLSDAGALASIGSVGDSYDNALAESVIGLYKLECVRRDGPFRTVDDLELATLNWVHWFNEHRLHSSLHLVPPIEFETAYYRQNNTQRQPSPGELASH
jgi:putative transposase